MQFDDDFASNAIASLPVLYKTVNNRNTDSETGTAPLGEGRSHWVSLLCAIAMLLIHFIFVER